MDDATLEKGIQKVRLSWREEGKLEGGRGWVGLKKRTKTNKGRGSQVYLYFRNVKKLPDFSKRKQSSGGGQLLKLLLF